MSKSKAIVAAIAAVAWSSSTNVSLAQYTGPPIIIQTPQAAPSVNTNTLKPIIAPTLQAAPTAAAAPVPAVPAPAVAAPARACAAGTKC